MKLATLLVITFVLVLAAPVLAQDNCTTGMCEPYSEDPGDGCIWGPTDPLCDPDGGGSCKYENCTSCYSCKYIPEGPSGEPAFYTCVSDLEHGTHIYCTGYHDTCSMDVWCKIA